MSWEKEVEELRRREAMARRMGGPDKIKRQHDGGKLTVRERIDRLLDKDTRKLLCEFATLAAPMRKPGPRSFGYRP